MIKNGNLIVEQWESDHITRLHLTHFKMFANANFSYKYCVEATNNVMNEYIEQKYGNTLHEMDIELGLHPMPIRDNQKYLGHDDMPKVVLAVDQYASAPIIDMHIALLEQLSYETMSYDVRVI